MRGLKLNGNNILSIGGWSHLLQMRGLKHISPPYRLFSRWSHLLQMRGLKHIFSKAVKAGRRRIFYRCVDWNIFDLPTIQFFDCRIFYRCVDWNNAFPLKTSTSKVASFTDAWIETRNFLKTLIQEHTSHLLQMRGLKPTTYAWKTHGCCRIFYRCVDWNHAVFYECTALKSRIFYRCVDWNLGVLYIGIEGLRRIFYRCVDWNLSELTGWTMYLCRIFYRCVDWNRSVCKNFGKITVSHLLQMRGLKHYFMCHIDDQTPSHLLQMRGLKLLGRTAHYTHYRSHLLQMRGLKPFLDTG